MRSVPALAVAAIALLCLTSCVKDEAPIIPDPVPTSDLLFASEDEALAAAEEAYGDYLAVVDQILHEGGADPERLLAVATESVYERQLEGFTQVANEGWHSTGNSTADSLTLQSLDQASSGESFLTVYACNDVSGVDLLDDQGVSVVSPDRVARTAYQLTFDADASSPSGLILSAETLWTGDDFCNVS